MKMQMRMAALAAGLLLSNSAGAALGSFTPGSVVMLRVGDGSVAFNSSYLAQPIYLDEYTLDGTSIGSHAIPSSGANAALLTSRGDDHDGHLNISGNGQYLTFGAYRTTPGAAYAANQTAAVTPRVVGVVDSSWTVDTSTALTNAYNGATINAAMTVDGSSFWTAGNTGTGFSGGLRYVPSKGSSNAFNISQTQAAGGLAGDAIRNARINNGQIYLNTAAQGSYANRGVYATSVPLPVVTANTAVPVAPVIVNKEGSTTDASGNPDPDGKGKLHPKSDSLFVDLNRDSTYDVAYTTGGKEDLEKWTFSAGVWTRSDLLYLLSGEEINALGYYYDGTSVNVFASVDAGLYSFTDSGGIGGINSATVAAPDFENKRYLTSSYLVQAAADQQFRGFAVIVPEPATLLGSLALGGLLMRRHGR